MTQPDQPAQPAQPPQPEPAAGSYEPPRQTIPGIRPPGFDSTAFEARSREFGREVEAAAQRVSHDPYVTGVADVLSRAWGLILLAVGVWFFADVTLELSLPGVRWDDLWPVSLVAIGAFVLMRGMTRRGA